MTNKRNKNILKLSVLLSLLSYQKKRSFIKKITHFNILFEETELLNEDLKNIIFNKLNEYTKSDYYGLSSPTKLPVYINNNKLENEEYVWDYIESKYHEDLNNKLKTLINNFVYEKNKLDWKIKSIDKKEKIIKLDYHFLGTSDRPMIILLNDKEINVVMKAEECLSDKFKNKKCNLSNIEEISIDNTEDECDPKIFICDPTYPNNNMSGRAGISSLERVDILKNKQYTIDIFLTFDKNLKLLKEKILISTFNFNKSIADIIKLFDNSDNQVESGIWKPYCSTEVDCCSADGNNISHTSKTTLIKKTITLNYSNKCLNTELTAGNSYSLEIFGIMKIVELDLSDFKIEVLAINDLDIKNITLSKTLPKTLEYLKLNNIQNLTELPELHENLKVLELENLPELSLPLLPKNLQTLKLINLEWLNDLNNLFEDENKIFSKDFNIQIQDCPNIPCEQLQSLKQNDGKCKKN
ncbi:hypothetical protein CPAV1605_806 [seawater metagenome]|uniref:Uncharacterized protein n=1 Tax=seawater metagenome TaxID=1561972 RepID=A0A5E8CIN7_9ZZZZ